MKPFSIVSIVTTLLALANTAAAQEQLDCPSVVAADGVDLTAPPDILHQPLAMPGAFGGEVFCQRVRTAKGIEQYFVETLPFNGNIAQAFQYVNSEIIFSLKIGAPDAPPIETAGCFPTDDEKFKCWVDLGVGDHVIVIFTYRASDTDSNISAVEIRVSPDYGILAPDVWERLKPLDPSGPDFDISMTMGTSGATETLPLNIKFNENDDTYYFAAGGQPAFDFLVAQSNENSDITITTVVELFERNESGTTLTTNRYQSSIGAQSTAFVIEKLFRLKDLMSAGFEGSKALNFEN